MEVSLVCSLADRIEQQDEVAQFLSENSHVQLANQEEASSCKLPKLLAGPVSCLRICSALLTHYQSGNGFHLAIKIFKVTVYC